jgi:hypothetical protein
MRKMEDGGFMLKDCLVSVWSRTCMGSEAGENETSALFLVNLLSLGSPLP